MVRGGKSRVSCRKVLTGGCGGERERGRRPERSDRRHLGGKWRSLELPGVLPAGPPEAFSRKPEPEIPVSREERRCLKPTHVLAEGPSGVLCANREEP